jgi:hypothetical protein
MTFFFLLAITDCINANAVNLLSQVIRVTGEDCVGFSVLRGGGGDDNVRDGSGYCTMKGDVSVDRNPDGHKNARGYCTMMWRCSSIGSVRKTFDSLSTGDS